MPDYYRRMQHDRSILSPSYGRRRQSSRTHLYAYAALVFVIFVLLWALVAQLIRSSIVSQYGYEGFDGDGNVVYVVEPSYWSYWSPGIWYSYGYYGHPPMYSSYTSRTYVNRTYISSTVRSRTTAVSAAPVRRTASGFQSTATVSDRAPIAKGTVGTRQAAQATKKAQANRQLRLDTERKVKQAEAQRLQQQRSGAPVTGQTTRLDRAKPAVTGSRNRTSTGNPGISRSTTTSRGSVTTRSVPSRSSSSSVSRPRR